MKINIFLIALIFLFSCESESIPKKNKNTQSSNFELVKLKWAKNFRIKKFENYHLIELLNNGEVKQTFTVGSEASENTATKIHFQTPVNKIASASCVYTKMFDILGDLDKIKGIDQLKFQYSTKTLKHVQENKILEFGSGINLKTEELFLLKPDVFFTWVSNQTSNQIKKVQKLGIPVLFLSSYLETHPLARAEWIKFFAVFTDKLNMAETIFNHTEKEYLKLQKNNLKNSTILVNAPYSGQWYLPTPKSYMGNLLRDSKFTLNDTISQQTGAIALSLEEIMAKYQNAEYWINPSYYQSLTELKDRDPRFQHFRSFKSGNIFNATKRQRKNGGNDYWELGVVRPDLVLKDLQKINKGMPSDSLFFFNKLTL